MKYLNLTKGFNPLFADTEDSIEFESFYFNGGEPHIKIKQYERDDVTIVTRLTSMNELMMLVCATDALYSLGLHNHVHLFTPYMPGSRQDRQLLGEPLTSRIIAQIINDLEFISVETYDNHSDVITALINNSVAISNHDFVSQCLNHIANNDLLIISPDAGSNKKMKDLMICINKYKKEPFSLIKCDKTRNVKTGELTGFEVYAENLEGRDCIIIDDICDGGGTFIGLAEELKKKNAGDLYLAVSHGIFSKGLKDLSKHFKKVYTTDSWRSEFSLEQQERDNTELVKIIKLSRIL